MQISDMKTIKQICKSANYNQEIGHLPINYKISPWNSGVLEFI